MKAEKILINGRIYTEDPQQPWAEALAILGKKILCVGGNETVEKTADKKTKIVDLKGKVVLPGFIDGHTHPTTVAKTFYHVRMPFTHDKGELLKNIKKYAEKYPKEERPYLFCDNYFAETFGEEGPKKEILDEIISDRPARIQDFTDHACWYNSVALEMLKDENGVPHSESPAGMAEFIKNEKGEYTGWCLESAPEGDLRIYKKIGWAPPETADEEMLQPLMDYFKQHGIMCLFDAFTENEDSIKLFYDMDQKGVLDIYYEGSVHVPAPEKIDEAINTVKSWQERYKSEHVHINTIKIFVDGTNEMGDCCSLRPFSNDPTGINKGAAYLSEEQLQNIMVKLNHEDIDLHLHVICDGAFRLVLNALESAQNVCGDTWKIHVTAAHCELVNPEDKNRVAKLGLYIDWSTHWSGGYFGEAAKTYLGEDRWNTMYDFKEIIADGANVGFSSDVFTYQEAMRANPFFGMQVAMTRIDPVITLDPEKYPGSVRPPESARLTLEELIRGYTINNAVRMRLENKMGSLEKGKLANFIILDQDIFNVPAAKISSVTAECAYFEGKERRVKSTLSVGRD